MMTLLFVKSYACHIFRPTYFRQTMHHLYTLNGCPLTCEWCDKREAWFYCLVCDIIGFY